MGVDDSQDSYACCPTSGVELNDVGMGAFPDVLSLEEEHIAVLVVSAYVLQYRLIVRVGRTNVAGIFQVLVMSTDGVHILSSGSGASLQVCKYCRPMTSVSSSHLSINHASCNRRRETVCSSLLS